MRRHLASLALCCLLAAGCASPPPPPQLPARALRAIAENNRGEQFFARGEYRQALEHFRAALAAAESVEDEDAIAANLINLSVVQQRVGDAAGAVTSVERVLNESNLRFPERRAAEAALRRALLSLDAGDAAAAQRWTQTAEHRCTQTCALNPKLLALRGYLAIAQGDGPAAERAGQETLALAEAAQDREERANGLRLIGIGALLQGEGARGLGPLAEALAIDKQLSLPRAIANDLMALARAHASLGETQQQRAYLERALAVAAADGNAPVFDQAKSALAALPGAAVTGSSDPARPADRRPAD